ncbi:phage/plasmid primase, P4 family [Aureimonas pseudogalii]|uniref:Putative DNA primase/helicase n=1 Tax=Aureimonas pseudogalii TaxID=1744844 RepID=A0A7W6E9S1_9HYPH|nr:phage/plasmid primase, P4 family [Aureimonas pseudogalii]MBB3996894.1 putative DNA primase/helicase [Aureimonas pseudogalii]
MQDKLNETVSLLAICASEPETDIGNGRRFIHRFGPDVLHIAKIGWHGYDGLRWREDDDGSVIRPLAQRTAEAIVFECQEIRLTDAEALIVEAGDEAEAGLADATKSEDAGRIAAAKAAIRERDRLTERLDKRRDRRASHARSTAGSAKMDNMLGEASPHLKRRLDDMNADPLALNCRNGTLRFVRIEDEESDPEEPRFVWRARLDPHRREDWITKLCEATACGPDGVPLEPGDRLYDLDFFAAGSKRMAPTFHTFMQTVQPAIQQRSYLQRHAGYCLTKLTSEQMIGFWYGIGANGKSTYADLISAILSDLAVTLSIDTFTGDAKRDGASATPDLVRLNGANLCIASEGDEGVSVKEGLIKTLTGGDRLPVRKMREEFVEIRVQAKFVIIGNHKPRIKNDDDGIWRRLHFVEWPVQIPEADRDKHLTRKLLLERDGVLAWMIAGALEFLTLGGLEPPDSVRAAVQEHREESDSMGAYIRGACEVTGEPAHHEGPGALHDAYVIFCRQEGLYPLHQATFNRRLPELTRRTFKAPDGRMTQFSKSKTGGATVYRGIQIKERFRGGPTTGTPDDRGFSPRD